MRSKSIRNKTGSKSTATPSRPAKPSARSTTISGKPRGAGLLRDFTMSVGDTVGNGFENEPRDVETVKRALGGLGYLPEDPFDRPSGFIEESTTKAIKRFQDNNRLTTDGWLGPKGETEAALQQAIDRLARVKRPEWLEYHRRAPSPEALKGVGILDNPAEAARLAAQLFKNLPAAGRGSLLQIGEPGSRSNEAGLASRNAPETAPKLSREPANEGVGSTSVDPEANFGSWAMKRSDVLPEGVDPPADPLKPDPLPRDMSNEMPRYEADGRMAPVDVGVSRKREVRWLISRLYRVGAQGEDGQFKLGDEDFNRYLAAAKEHVKPEQYSVFELTARAVRAGALDWHTAATRLAAYYAPETTGEAVVDFLLDLTPVVGQVKAAKELHGALEDAVDAAAYGDARAHDAALTAAAMAMAMLILPGAPGKALKLAAKVYKQELHHLVPFYLGGVKDGPLLALTRTEHRGAAASLHTKMQQFFRESEHLKALAFGPTNSAARIVADIPARIRRSGLDQFYRSLEKSSVPHERLAFESWVKIFPEISKYLPR